MATIRIDEACRGMDGKWSFTDIYWIDPDSGLAWRSRQHIEPEGPDHRDRDLAPAGLKKERAARPSPIHSTMDADDYGCVPVVVVVTEPLPLPEATRAMPPATTPSPRTIRSVLSVGLGLLHARRLARSQRGGSVRGGKSARNDQARGHNGCTNSPHLKLL